MRKRDDESGPMRATKKKPLSQFDMKAWEVFGHVPNPFTGKVETFEEMTDRLGYDRK